MKSPTVIVAGTRFGEPVIEREELAEFSATVTLMDEKNIQSADIILAGSGVQLNAELIETLPHCGVIVRYGVGLDNVDVAAATAKNIVVSYLPNYATDEVANHNVALILACQRKLFAGLNTVRNGEWGIGGVRPINAAGSSIAGIIGFGRIGQAVAKRLIPFGYEIWVSDPVVSDDVVAEYGAKRVEMPALLASADIVSLNAPLTKDTKHLINKNSLATMKATACIVNTSRGGLIDQDALIEALQNGTIAAAGLDVYEKEPLAADHPIRQVENAILTPHMAWYSNQGTERMRRQGCQEAARALRGEVPLNCVNPHLMGSSS